MKKPHKVTITCPAFNHEKYVKYFIESVLNQTIQDFELLIIDDCSSDNTVNEIRKFNDARIKLIQHEWNKGFVVAWNDLIKHATGDIICFCALDDILMPNYLEEVLRTFENDKTIDIVYVSYESIDENNIITRKCDLKLDSTLTKYETLQKLFMYGNHLPSPGMAYKKSIIKKILPFSCGLLQYIDWQIHIKLLLNGCNIKCIEQPLLKCRISSNSASARSINVLKREACETYSIMDPFLEIKDLEFFKKVFEGLYNEFGEPTIETIPYFIARMAMKSPFPDKQRWGYEALLKFIADRKNYETIYKLFGIDFKKVINSINNCTFLDNRFIDKYKKYKRLYYIFLSLFILVLIIIGVIVWLK